MAARNEEESTRDKEIDYINKKRKIPLELLAEERLIYGYSQSVTIKQLEGIRNKYEAHIESDLG